MRKQEAKEVWTAARSQFDKIPMRVSDSFEEWWNEQQQVKKCDLSDVMGGTSREKWENLKKYILTQTEKIDKETPWQNREPEWWLEMQTIELNIRQYCQ